MQIRHAGYFIKVILHHRKLSSRQRHTHLVFASLHQVPTSTVVLTLFHTAWVRSRRMNLQNDTWLANPQILFMVNLIALMTHMNILYSSSYKQPHLMVSIR